MAGKCQAVEPFCSQQFDDIYFSREDGLAEARHVFLGGNGLPEGWGGQHRFTILETGFGTGLNFLAAWQAFLETAPADAVLDFISIEKYPLAPAEIRAALAPWRGELGPLLGQLLARYPLRVPGFHRLLLGRARLTLVFDDVNAALPQLDIPGGVDAWFLDGFAPAKNPDMWGAALYREMARLSAPGARAASFTAAGLVRRGLAEAGFAVEKARGFGRKRDMTIARFPGARPQRSAAAPKCVAVIGGGLAGTACAAQLLAQGARPVIFEKAPHLAAGASGNPLGLFNPRLSALRDAGSDFYTAAFAQAARRFGPGCGSLHLLTNEERGKKLRRSAENWGWHADHMRLLSPPEASAVAGVEITCEALYLPDAGAVFPAALCTDYAQGCETRLATPFTPEAYKEGWDAIILANGADARAYADWLPLHTVRGQISRAPETPRSHDLACNLCYGGYLSPAQAGRHTLGASFQKWREDCDLDPADDAANLARLHEAVPSLRDLAQAQGARAALRTASQDRFPLIGPVSGARLEGPVYISGGHGSHGLVSSLAGGVLLADMILSLPRSLSAATVAALAPQRFLDRAKTKRPGKTGAP
jgi:tRNA 5-methylaminomethyl-2-thiouridine biosynthesis bifunctional protein